MPTTELSIRWTFHSYSVLTVTQEDEYLKFSSYRRSHRKVKSLSQSHRVTCWPTSVWLQSSGSYLCNTAFKKVVYQNWFQKIFRRVTALWLQSTLVALRREECVWALCPGERPWAPRAVECVLAVASDILAVWACLFLWTESGSVLAVDVFSIF